MAQITKHGFVRHLRSDPTAYVLHLRRGRVGHAGAGQAFWFRPAVAALAEIPLDDREQALLFRAVTRDFQEVSVQATVTYRVVDPQLTATRVDFGIDPEVGTWNATPLEQLGGLLTELAQQPALEQLARMELADALVEGTAPVRAAVRGALDADERLAERGLVVTDVRVVAIRTNPEIERALQTATREAVQQDADRATFERRALAVELERAIAENELQNRIELARREEQLVVQEGQNQQRRATEQAAADRIATEVAAELRRVTADAEAGATRVLGEAEGHAEAARLGAYGQLDHATIMALALQELAGNLPAVEHLTITPDLLTQLAGHLLGAGATGGA